MEAAHARSPSSNPWLSQVQTRVERELTCLLDLPDEQGVDARWSRARELLKAYALRPAKRLRPALLTVGYELAARRSAPEGIWKFAAALELAHTFLLIHDDVADQGTLRRGGPALHRILRNGKLGEDLAVVLGDHLFARSIEAMLESDLPRAGKAAQHFLGICRQTAAGQYLDLDLSRTPLAQVTLFQTLKVAHLKTARYGFVAPLVCGALLAEGSPALVEGLDRVGRHLGLAYQLRDDLIGLFGDEAVCGKSAASDLVEGKRTFPVLAAFSRAPESVRQRFESLWSSGVSDPAELHEARTLVERHGGREATEHAIERASRSARRALAALPSDSPVRGVLDGLIGALVSRSV